MRPFALSTAAACYVQSRLPVQYDILSVCKECKEDGLESCRCFWKRQALGHQRVDKI